MCFLYSPLFPVPGAWQVSLNKSTFRPYLETHVMPTKCMTGMVVFPSRGPPDPEVDCVRRTVRSRGGVSASNGA